MAAERVAMRQTCQDLNACMQQMQALVAELGKPEVQSNKERVTELEGMFTNKKNEQVYLKDRLDGLVKIIDTAKMEPNLADDLEEEAWTRVRNQIKAKYIRRTLETELDRLQRIKKHSGQSWSDFLTKFEQKAPIVAPSHSADYTRVLVSLLPGWLKVHIVAMKPETTLEQMIGQLRTVLFWNSDTQRGGNRGPTAMDIDMMHEAQDSPEGGQQLYIGQGIQRPVYSGKYIHYNNISGPKTLMLAWKTLIRHHREFLQESKQFLRHLATQEAAQRADLLEDVGGEQDDKEGKNVQ